VRGKRRTKDFHFIKTPTDAVYYAAEIPRTAWKAPKHSSPGFQLVVVGEKTLTPAKQKTWYKRLWEGEMFSDPYLVLLCSEHTDSLAIEIGYDLMKKALAKGLRVQITESSRIREEETREETVFMLFNVYDEAPPDRIQQVRDWAYRHKTVFRIICAVGDPGTLLRKLKLKFNAVFLVENKIREERTLA
jgi:hypothetical protein